jgi:MFS family permease
VEVAGRAAGAAVALAAALGLVSLMADVVYEGGRSVQGPVVASLGAPALAAGVLAAGEAVAYLARPLGALLASRLGYWPTLALGYSLSLTAVPLIALAPGWREAVALYLAERLGKAVRAPVRDAIIAGYSLRAGVAGRAFAVHEALDQVGALAGPLLVASIVVGAGGWRPALAALSIPAAVGLALLAALAVKVGEPGAAGRWGGGASRGLAYYSLLHPLGAPQWSVVSFALALQAPPEAVALAYSAAMALDAAAAVAAGVLVDRGAGRAALLLTPLGGLAAYMGAAAALAGAPQWAALALAAAGVGLAYGGLESAGRAWVAVAWGPSPSGYAAYGALRGVAMALNGALAAYALSLAPEALAAAGSAMASVSAAAALLAGRAASIPRFTPR